MLSQVRTKHCHLQKIANKMCIRDSFTAKTDTDNMFLALYMLVIIIITCFIVPIIQVSLALDTLHVLSEKLSKNQT